MKLRKKIMEGKFPNFLAFVHCMYFIAGTSFFVPTMCQAKPPTQQQTAESKDIKSISAQYLVASRHAKDCHDTLKAAKAAEGQSQDILSRAQAANDSEAISISRNALAQAQTAVAEARHKCFEADTNMQHLARMLNIAKKIQRLKARDRKLSTDIDMDLNAIRHLGFNRRAEDFAEWENLGINAQNSYEQELKTQLEGIFVAHAQDKIPNIFKHIDDAHLKKLISLLKKKNYPGRNKMLQALGQMLAMGSKGRAHMIEQVSVINTGIERGIQGAGTENRNGMLQFAADFICDAAEELKGCHLFESDVSVTAAALYNNAARRVALHEVNRLIDLTDTELVQLKHLNQRLIAQVKKRNRIRATIKEVERNETQ